MKTINIFVNSLVLPFNVTRGNRTLQLQLPFCINGNIIWPFVISSTRCSYTCASVWRSPLENVAYERVLAPPAVSRMSCSSNLDGLRDDGRWPYSCSYMTLHSYNLIWAACHLFPQRWRTLTYSVSGNDWPGGPRDMLKTTSARKFSSCVWSLLQDAYFL